MAINSSKSISLKNAPPPGNWTKFLRYVEDRAAAIRDLSNVDVDAPLDPRRLAHKFGVLVVGIDEIARLSAQDRKLIRPCAAGSPRSTSMPGGETA